MPKTKNKTAADQPDSRSTLMNRNLLPLIAAVLLIVVAGMWFLLNRPQPAYEPKAVVAAPVTVAVAKPAAPAQLVDEQQCQGCHGPQFKDWQGSHHQLAMQAATPETVLADFNNVQFKSEGETTRFFRQNDEYRVNTPGPEGKATDFKVAYTFGIAPLQQYLIEVGDGRLQALGVAWDTEKNRWFHLYPGQGVNFKNTLHWS